MSNVYVTSKKIKTVQTSVSSKQITLPTINYSVLRILHFSATTPPPPFHLIDAGTYYFGRACFGSYLFTLLIYFCLPTSPLDLRSLWGNSVGMRHHGNIPNTHFNLASWFWNLIHPILLESLRVLFFCKMVLLILIAKIKPLCLEDFQTKPSRHTVDIHFFEDNRFKILQTDRTSRNSQLVFINPWLD